MAPRADRLHAGRTQLRTAADQKSIRFRNDGSPGRAAAAPAEPDEVIAGGDELEGEALVEAEHGGLVGGHGLDDACGAVGVAVLDLVGDAAEQGRVIAGGGSGGLHQQAAEAPVEYCTAQRLGCLRAAHNGEGVGDGGGGRKRRGEAVAPLLRRLALVLALFLRPGRPWPGAGAAWAAMAWTADEGAAWTAGAVGEGAGRYLLHGWNFFHPQAKNSAGSPPSGGKNASSGAQRLKML